MIQRVRLCFEIKRLFLSPELNDKSVLKVSFSAGEFEFTHSDPHDTECDLLVDFGR